MDHKTKQLIVKINIPMNLVTSAGFDALDFSGEHDMATAEERLKILEMVQEHKISPEEGARLLQALQAGSKKGNNGRDPRWLRIRITDLKSGQAKVNVNIR